MKSPIYLSQRDRAQTLVFFALGFGTIFLLCGLAIDSGLLYLEKARLSRAVDGASLAAIGNFHQSDDPTTNRSLVATTMRNFAIANFTDLGQPHARTGWHPADFSISATPVIGSSQVTLPSGLVTTSYSYRFDDGTQDANGAYRKYVEVLLQTGAGGQITSATCVARCPARTYFMWLAGSFFDDLKVSSAAGATRNPRLIMVVVDRSGSMLGNGGGAFGLPASVVTFLNFFDTSSDYIGLVSFSSNARLEMPLTTNFLYAGTNIFFDSYQINSNVYPNVGIPGVDPEEYSSSANYDPNYATSGVRRLKFGGSTAADEGIRLGLETLMANSGFNNPDVVKYMVVFTDGAWNCTRTLLAAPGYTNVIVFPPDNSSPSQTNLIVSSTNSGESASIFTAPGLSPYVDMTNAIQDNAFNGNYVGFGFSPTHHTNDVWQSIDGSTNEADPITGIGTSQGAHQPGQAWPEGPGRQTSTTVEGQPMCITNYPYMGIGPGGQAKFSTTLNVWVPPGAVDYVYDHLGHNTINYVGNYNSPTNTYTVELDATQSANGSYGCSNVLVVPGYIVDGNFTDDLDLPAPDFTPGYRSYRWEDYQAPFMWPDDTSTDDPDNYTYLATGYTVHSAMRELMYRNYANLLTGYYIYRADDPPSVPPTLDPITGATRPLYGLGPYYPGGAVYWPFDLVGVDSGQNFALRNATVDPSAGDAYDSDGPMDPKCRFLSYTINMSSTNAAPEWSGELFYRSIAGDKSLSGVSAASTLMASASDWQQNIPPWITSAFQSLMTTDPVHNSNLAVQNWRPTSFNGTGSALPYSSVSQSDGANYTGGWVTDGNNNYWRNAMAYSGRPTHFYDFSLSKWVPISTNHEPTYIYGTNNTSGALALGNWKAQEYAWHARAAGVTIYTVGYGNAVDNTENLLLAQIANSTNMMDIHNVQTNISFNGQQPIGQQFFATNNIQISNDFYSIGQAINAALTQ